jgi:3-carboxy-cis,cis-muconate cycloisomerase
MARFESALAQASAEHGVIPAAEAQVISAACERAAFDAAALAREAREAGTLAIPFVKALTQQVATLSAPAARFVHFGATSQDVSDTGFALCLKKAGERLIELALELGDALARLAGEHRDTPILARTLLQPAAPVPFGWKAAIWLAPLARALPAFRAALDDACALQFGGASGTLSAFGSRGHAVAESLAKRIGLARRVTWHSARDAFVRLGAEAAILTGLSAKIGGDIALLMQAEVGELAEPLAAGRGGSSSMPHKHNPSLSMLALEAGRRVPGLAAILLNQLQGEHERGLGQWQSQWLTLRELMCASASALGAMTQVLSGLQVNVNAMHANIERTKGLVYSEAAALRLSRAIAERLCAQAIREGRPLQEVMRGDSEATRALPAAEMAMLFDPRNGFGAASAMIDGVLRGWASARGSAP